MRRPWHGVRRLARGRNGILQAWLDRMFRTPLLQSPPWYYNSPFFILTQTCSVPDPYARSPRSLWHESSKGNSDNPGGICDRHMVDGSLARGKVRCREAARPAIFRNHLKPRTFCNVCASRSQRADWGGTGYCRVIGSEEDETPTDHSRPYHASSPDLWENREER